jgi:hypothetical protein
MTKMEITDDFIAEASEFKVKRVYPKKGKVAVENGENVKCSKIKKNGECCVYKAKVGGFCGKHAPKSVVSALSDEFVGNSSDETGSVVESVVEDGCVECVGCGEAKGPSVIIQIKSGLLIGVYIRVRAPVY